EIRCNLHWSALSNRVGDRTQDLNDVRSLCSGRTLRPVLFKRSRQLNHGSTPLGPLVRLSDIGHGCIVAAELGELYFGLKILPASQIKRAQAAMKLDGQPLRVS